MLILVVAFDPDEQRLLANCIGQHKCESLAAENLKSALKIIERDRIELVFLSLNGHLSQALYFLQTLNSFQQPPTVIVTSSKASLDEAVAMMKAGAHDFWIKPIDPQRFSKTLEWFSCRPENIIRSNPASHSPIITNNASMLRLKEISRRIAPSNATVFIQGESGTGKELFARYLHQNSERRKCPFIGLNCAALPETLIESELFGHEKGAFTGALKLKQGKFELAHTGTLFLDEVTEIPLHLQPKMLRVLQENELDRLGGKYSISIDVRVVASTNLAVEEALKAGQFRKDLYYRLNVIPLKLPPLRERQEDIPLLCRHFLQKYNDIHKCSVVEVAPEAIRTLSAHSWPGNVRELENVMQRAILLARGPVIGKADIFFDQTAQEESAEVELMPIDDMEKLLIQKALSTCNGNRTRAADILGISVRTLRNKLSLYSEQTEAANCLSK
jgi:DNA-binding NtrC family response regulator